MSRTFLSPLQFLFLLFRTRQECLSFSVSSLLGIGERKRNWRRGPPDLPFSATCKPPSSLFAIKVQVCSSCVLKTRNFKSFRKSNSPNGDTLWAIFKKIVRQIRPRRALGKQKSQLKCTDCISSLCRQQPTRAKHTLPIPPPPSLLFKGS